jgi:hypothetical protein
VTSQRNTQRVRRLAFGAREPTGAKAQGAPWRASSSWKSTARCVAIAAASQSLSAPGLPPRDTMSRQIANRLSSAPHHRPTLYDGSRSMSATRYHGVCSRTRSQCNEPPFPPLVRHADPLCPETSPSLNTPAPAAPPSPPTPTISAAASNSRPRAAPSRSPASSPSAMSAPPRTSLQRRASYP